MTRKMVRTISAASLLFLGTGLVSAQHSKIAPDLQARDANSTVDVIVSFHRAPSPEQHQRIATRGRRINGDLGSRHAAYRIPAGALSELANDPEVEYVAPDRPVNGFLDTAVPAVNANIVRSFGLSGAGIGIALLDSGILPEADIAAPRVVYHESFVKDHGTNDKYGHGTHIAGILGGTGNKSKGIYAGIAPGANIINLRVLDENGAGSDSGVIAAIQRAIQLKSKYNIRIINLSLGRGVYESYKLDPLCQAVEAAWKAGIVVVVAAGNDGRDDSFKNHGYATIEAPGNDPYVITVGAMKTMGTATRADDMIASYSSKGPTALDHIVKPDLVAPGNRVVSLFDKDSTLADAFPGNVIDKNYFQLSGTSMAAPMVSGAAALLLQARPDLTPDQVKARLMKTASKKFPVSSFAVDPGTNQQYQSFYDVFTVGAGYLDVAAALASTDMAKGLALSPTAVYSPSSKTVTMENTPCPAGMQVIWGEQVIWGDQVVWGDQVIWGDQVVWGDQVIWGDALAVHNLFGPKPAKKDKKDPGESTGIAVHGEY